MTGDSLLPRRLSHGRHCTCSACAREEWPRITAPCGMHGADCPAEYAPLGVAGDWTCPACGMKQNGDHAPNTLCPYGLVAAMESGFITPVEACRRLESAA